MKVLLFLGSGVSFQTDLPNVNEITTSLLEKDWHNHTDQCFYSGKHPNEFFEPMNVAPRVQSYLKILKKYADDYLKKKYKYAKSNYEDLFYISEQIVDDLDGEIDNPVLEPFINTLIDETKELCTPIPMTGQGVDLRFLASRACDLIKCVVWHELYTEKEPIGLDLINEIHSSDKITLFDIVTLNHDLLIEILLNKIGVEFIDGFGQQEGDVRYFDSALFEKKDMVRLFKLHGSINWHRFRIEENGSYEDKYGMTNADYQHCRDVKGNFLLPLTIYPMFLSGSYNKMIDYGFGIFAQLHHMSSPVENSSIIPEYTSSLFILYNSKEIS